MDQILTLGTKVRYGLADMGFALLSAAQQFFLLFYYTDVARINPALAGAALMVAKLTWDAINDPLFGYWSDRTRSRFGRRRIYMLIAAVPMGFAALIMFSIPKGLTGVAAFLPRARRWMHRMGRPPDPRNHRQGPPLLQRLGYRANQVFPARL